MAKVMASRFRGVKQVGEDQYQLIFLQPGDDPSVLPKDIQEELEKEGLIQDEKRMSADYQVRLPYGHPDTVVEEEPKAEVKKEEPKAPAPTKAAEK